MSAVPTVAGAMSEIPAILCPTSKGKNSPVWRVALVIYVKFREILSIQTVLVYYNRRAT